MHSGSASDLKLGPVYTGRGEKADAECVRRMLARTGYCTGELGVPGAVGCSVLQGAGDRCWVMDGVVL